jgi:hypothetical protein
LEKTVPSAGSADQPMSLLRAPGVGGVDRLLHHRGRVTRNVLIPDLPDLVCCQQLLRMEHQLLLSKMGTAGSVASVDFVALWSPG